jgi:hypothetical protein
MSDFWMELNVGAGRGSYRKLCHITRFGRLSAEERLARKAGELHNKGTYSFGMRLLPHGEVPRDHPLWRERT